MSSKKPTIKKPTQKRGRKAKITTSKSENSLTKLSKKDLKVYSASGDSPTSEQNSDDVIILRLKVDIKNLKTRSKVPIPYSSMGYEFEHFTENMSKPPPSTQQKEQLKQIEQSEQSALTAMSTKIMQQLNAVENKVMNRVIESMLEYSEAKKQKKWPNHVNIACFWCSEFFDTIPVGIPRKVETKTLGLGKKQHTKKMYYCEDNYCTFECATADLFHQKRGNYRERFSLLCSLYKDAHNLPKVKKIKSALPRRALTRYGGPHSIERFRQLSKQDNVVYNVVEPPMIPVLSQLESNCMDFNTANRSNSYIPINRQLGNIPSMNTSMQPLKSQFSTPSSEHHNSNTLLKFMKSSA